MGKFLDSTGITHLWEKAKSAFSLSGHKHTTSDITDIATVAKTGKYSDLSGTPTIPTNNNQLTNGAGYQTASDVTKAVSSAVGKITSFDAQVVTTLPTTGTKGVIYLIADSHSDSNDSYDEYIWLEDKEVFEKVGNTDVDLSQYVTTSNMNTALKGYLPTSTNYAGSSSVGGAATSAVKATQDSDGNQINTTYLKRSGGTMTGDIHFSKDDKAHIVSFDFGSDTYASIGAYHTGHSAGLLQLLTYAYNQLPIYVRQYDCNSNTFYASATLLDEKGNTVFPNTVTASKFKGSFEGNVTGTASNVSGTVAVGNGGTGATTLASGQALIGNGTGAVSTRAIKDITTNSALGWTSGDNSLIDANTLAYWNGAYSGNSSSLKYCVKGAFGDIVTHNTSEYAKSSHTHTDSDITWTDEEPLTNIGIESRNATQIDFAGTTVGGSDTGVSASLYSATTSLAGLMSATDKTKLDGLYNTTQGQGVTYDGTALNLGTRWDAITHQQYWSRVCWINVESCDRGIEGFSGILTLTSTRDSVVHNATFIINASHSLQGHIQQLNATDYTNVNVRIVSNAQASTYIEVYDNAVNLDKGGAQTWHCTWIPLSQSVIGTYTEFTDGTTIPSGYSPIVAVTSQLGGAMMANNFVGKWCGYTNDMGTENSSDTWVPVIRDGSLQHRVLSKETWTFTLEDGSTVTKDVTLG